MASYATSSEFPSDAVRAALGTSLDNGTFTDTIYYLFSSKLASGKVGKPRVIYANSAVLKASGEHFVART